MVHKAFDLIGERVLIVDSSHRDKEGIFWESNRFNTTAEGKPRPALDFIEPIYNPNPKIEDIARGIDPRKRINPKNPILSLHCGVDHLLLHYQGERNSLHIFEGRLVYVQGAFFNDGNFEIYDKYIEPLRNVGFEIS